jgi:hypothetical protein
MKDFSCWDDGEVSEACATLMERCFDAEDAATSYAKRVYDDSAGECGREFKVKVCEDGTTTIQTFMIDVEYEPTFTAWEEAA